MERSERLRRTLVHELCHVAAWLLDHVAKPPHGEVRGGQATAGLRARGSAQGLGHAGGAGHRG